MRGGDAALGGNRRPAIIMPNILAVRRNVDVTAWYDRGVLEVSAPVRAVKPEGTRIPAQDADATPGQLPDRAG